MIKIMALCSAVILLACHAHAAQSVITEMNGDACMGDDRSRKQTESLAMEEARRKAAEYAATYIKSETHVKDSELQSDLISAYAKAKVSVLQELEKKWYKNESSGECFMVRLKVEVTPDLKGIKAPISEDPAAPLDVKVWADKKAYKLGDKIRIYLKGNKPFYANVVYKDAAANMVQLLPNPYRKDNYFNGGVIYELPSSGDKFDLEVSPPFGAELLSVYASTNPVGELETSASGGIYTIKTKPADIASGTRGVKLKGSATGARPTAEFSEISVELQTGR